MTTIACGTCGATAWPSDPSVRSTFGLICFDPNGAPCAGDVDGATWFCELHHPERKRPPRTASLGETLIDVEERLRKALAVLEDEVDGSDFDANHANREAVEAFRAELERGLEALRKVIVAHEPKPAAPKPKKASPTVHRKDQGELLAPKAAPASDNAPAEEVEWT
jgi:hypothetical protein